MNYRKLLAIATASMALSACSVGAGYNPNRDPSPPTGERPVNPYSNGGFSDPGPNYPPTGK